MSECVSMPGIRKVWYLDADNLPEDVVYRAVAGIPVDIPAQATEVSLKGDAVCETEEQPDNNSHTERARLTFHTLTELPTDRNLAFAFQTAGGDCFLIGSRERPHPVVKVSRSSGLPEGDASVRRYEVSLTARKALASCTA